MQIKPYLKEISLKRERVEDFEVYPFCIPGVKNLKSLKFHPDVTFLVGENGSGKSTLIEAIAVGLGFNPKEEQSNHSSQLTARIQSCTNT